MKYILTLEKELRSNKINILRIENKVGISSSLDFEYRTLIVQRSNLKDMLIDAYRKELLEQIKDDEVIEELRGE